MIGNTMKMCFVPEQVIYEDDSPAPWWKIKIYKNGVLFDEASTQYSSEIYVRWICFKTNLYEYILYIFNKMFVIK